MTEKERAKHLAILDFYNDLINDSSVNVIVKNNGEVLKYSIRTMLDFCGLYYDVNVEKDNHEMSESTLEEVIAIILANRIIKDKNIEIEIASFNALSKEQQKGYEYNYAKEAGAKLFTIITTMLKVEDKEYIKEMKKYSDVEELKDYMLNHYQVIGRFTTIAPDALYYCLIDFDNEVSNSRK